MMIPVVFCRAVPRQQLQHGAACLPFHPVCICICCLHPGKCSTLQQANVLLPCRTASLATGSRSPLQCTKMV